MKKTTQLIMFATLISATNSYGWKWENLKSWFGSKQPYDYRPSEEYLNKKHLYLQDQTNKQQEQIENAQYYHQYDPNQKSLQVIKNRESRLRQLELHGNKVYAEVAKKEAARQKPSLWKSFRSWLNPTPGPEYEKLETQEIIREINPVRLETQVVLPKNLEAGKSYQLKNTNNDDIYIKSTPTKKTVADIEEKQKQARGSRSWGEYPLLPLQPKDVPNKSQRTYLTPKSREYGLTYLRSYYLQPRRNLEKTTALPQDSE